MILLSKNNFLEKFPVSLCGDSYEDARGSLVCASARYVFSNSYKNVFRGLHIDPRFFLNKDFYQTKTIIILEGLITEYIFCMDDRSNDYLKVFTCNLESGNSFTIPNGWAHGFYASTNCRMLYLIEGSSNNYLNESYTTNELKKFLLRNRVKLSNKDLNAQLII